MRVRAYVRCSCIYMWDIFSKKWPEKTIKKNEKLENATLQLIAEFYLRPHDSICPILGLMALVGLLSQSISL